MQGVPKVLSVVTFGRIPNPLVLSCVYSWKTLSVYNSFQILVGLGYKLISFYMQEPPNNERVARE